jgi:hypothetical protein
MIETIIKCMQKGQKVNISLAVDDPYVSISIRFIPENPEDETPPLVFRETKEVILNSGVSELITSAFESKAKAFNNIDLYNRQLKTIEQARKKKVDDKLNEKKPTPGPKVAATPSLFGTTEEKTDGDSLYEEKEDPIND